MSKGPPWLSLPEELADILSRLPDLSEALRKAPLELKRQVFEAFCLQIRYDKVERRIEISATVSDAVARLSRTQRASRRRLWTAPPSLRGT